MIAHVYTRHSRSCSSRDSQYKRCRCTKWVTYTLAGKQYRESTKERSWEQAVLFAHKIELRYQNSDRPKPMQSYTVEQAVKTYLDDKRAQQLKNSTLRKYLLWFEKELVEFCKKHQVLYIKDLNLGHLREWRTGWKLGSQSSQKKQESVRQFFNFCFLSGWITENPAKGLSKIQVKAPPTDYFTDDEIKKILRVAQGKLHSLILLMRWSGLAIRDAVTLE